MAIIDYDYRLDLGLFYYKRNERNQHMAYRENLMKETISSKLLYQAILQGAVLTGEKREELNRINVFPVVDNDTGNNLAHTMQYIINNAEFLGDTRSTLRAISRAAIIGARGNSGTIFSQYFNGLYHKSKESSEVTLPELAEYFYEAYDKAYKTLDEPVEGTVITLMRAWALSISDSLKFHLTAKEIFESALKHIHKSLKETTQKLQVLRPLNIVDAGALGFYTFMEGFVQTITGRTVYEHTAVRYAFSATGQEDIHLLGENADIPYRYCTEVLFEAEQCDTDSFRSRLKHLGDCLLLSSADSFVRVHIHTNQPWEVVKFASKQGRILEQKAEDMVVQNLLTRDPKTKVACVTDSVADIPRSFIYEHHVFQIPINILIDGINYEDKVTVDSDFLNEHLDSASSAQLNKEQARAFLEPILEHYEHVLVLAVSSQMSGTYFRIREALEELDPKNEKSVVIDTLVNSGAQGMLVQEAVKLIEEGKPFDEVINHMLQLRERARIIVSVPNIEPMVNSGRISEKVGKLLIRLGFCPLVTINRQGKGTIKGLAFSSSQNHRLLIKHLKRAKIESYAIVHAAKEEFVEEIKNKMISFTNEEPLYVSSISSVVELFAGRGCLAVAYFEKGDGKGEKI
ncbi:MAG: DegV family EDD domain-containing protein [Clostridia bacterium]|nr:DegV family EDD domain-containing protein [Clostridia bacterium]